MRCTSGAILVALILLVSVCSCTSDGGAGSGREGSGRESRERSVGGGSLFDQLDAKRQSQRERGRVQPVAMDAGANELAPGWRERMDGWWQNFLKDSSTWPSDREQWIALGRAAQNILAENLLRALILSFDAGDGPTYHRSRESLATIKDAATPYLIEGISGPVRSDSVVRNHCSELIAYFGDSTLPGLENAYRDSGTRGKADIARALKRMLSPRSVPFLIDIAGSSEDFSVRIEAIEALGTLQAKEAVPVFMECLSDRDVSVRKFAASYASGLGDSSSGLLESLITCLERAQAAGEGDVIRASRGSLKRIVGRDLGTDGRAWRDYLRSNPPRRSGS